MHESNQSVQFSECILSLTTSHLCCHPSPNAPSSISCLEYYLAPTLTSHTDKPVQEPKWSLKNKKQMWFSYSEPFNSLSLPSELSLWPTVYPMSWSDPLPDCLDDSAHLTALWVHQAPKSVPFWALFASHFSVPHHNSSLSQMYPPQLCTPSYLKEYPTTILTLYLLSLL